jgi:hypothetical protein
VFYEKFWVTGNTITVLKWNISFCRAGRNYKFSSDKLSFDRNKTEVSSQENGYSFEHNLISSGAYGRDKEMSVNKFMQLWEYGYFVVQELDNVYTKTVGQPWDLTRMGTATDEKLDIAIKATGIDVIDITKDQGIQRTQVLSVTVLQEQKYLPRIFAVKILEYQISKMKEDMAHPFSTRTEHTRGEIKILEDFIKQFNSYIMQVKTIKKIISKK